MEPKTGDVVQLWLQQGHWANDLLMIVEDVKSWGFIGMIPTPTGDAPMRVKKEEIKQLWQRVTDG